MSSDQFSANEVGDGSGGSAADLTTIGPLDVGTTRSAYTLASAKLASMVLVIGAALVSAVMLAPFVTAGLGLAPQHTATVVSTSTGAGSGAESPAADGTDPVDRNRSNCVRTTLDLTWGDGVTGTATTCVPDPATGPQRGDTMTIWALPGYEKVAIGSRTPSIIVTLLAAVAVALAAFGAVIYWREVAALKRVRQGSVETMRLSGRRDRLSLTGVRGPMGRATLRVNFDGTSHAYRPLRMQAAGVTAEAMNFIMTEVYPLRMTRRGTPAGPYVLRPLGTNGVPIGTMIAIGRALKPNK